MYFYSKTNQKHNISNLFYFGTTLYTFRKVFPSIIRSLRLYIQHQVYVVQVLWLLEIYNISNLFYFGTTFYMFRTVATSIIRSLRLYIQHQVYVIQFCGCLRCTISQIYFILQQNSTCFGRSLRPSSGV